MPFMSTNTQTNVDEDAEAVLQHAFQRKPLDPDVARRVRERAAEITERIRRTKGVIDDATFESLLEEE
jgi:hypothetical protein